MIRLTLDKYLDSHKISRYDLAKRTGIEYHIIDKYYKNKVVRYDSYLLDKICTALDCDVSDLIESRPPAVPVACTSPLRACHRLSL